MLSTPFSPIHLSLFLLVSSICSAAGVRQDARSDRLHLATQKRALPILVHPSSSIGLFNASGIDDAALIQVETPSGNRLWVVCNGTQFGAGLSARSCADALGLCPTGDAQESWGGPDDYPRPDVVLPYAVYSGTQFARSKMI